MKSLEEMYVEMRDLAFLSAKAGHEMRQACEAAIERMKLTEDQVNDIARRQREACALACRDFQLDDHVRSVPLVEVKS